MKDKADLLRASSLEHVEVGPDLTLEHLMSQLEVGRPALLSTLKEAGVACTTGVWTGKQVLWCRDPDMNELMFVEEPDIQPIAEARDGPMVPWTRLW